jgi:tRNA (mo5U34)-methyltransferase
MDYHAFLQKLATTDLSSHVGLFEKQISKGLDTERYGDLPRWQKVLNQLPDWPTADIALDQSVVSIKGKDTPTEQQLAEFTELLKQLHPWRKGPYSLFGVDIDTEWRSDWKWERLKEHIEPLPGRNVLDIGCGSGYHCWRMRGAGADLVMGIDPTPLFIMQFATLQKYIQDHNVGVLPMGIEQLPEKLRFFDTVFSMGVLYHRRSPFDHLLELRDTLRSGGQLVLETLVIDGEQDEVLVPRGRYARMGNVWFIPSCPSLSRWLQKVGFKNVHLVDVTETTTEEQRSTDWMQFYSLENFLDPEDPSKTIEGYPAPKRAIVTATAP